MGGIFSSVIRIFGGLPQGGVICCILFAYYIHDLPEAIAVPMVKSKCFADDLGIWCQGSSLDVASRPLQLSLSALVPYCKEKHILYNLEKSGSAWFSLKHLPEDTKLRLYLDNPTSVIQTLHIAVYLGYHLDRTLSFTPHIKKMSTKASQLLHIIQKIMSKSYGVDIATGMKVYNAMIQTHLLFGCELYSRRQRYL